MSKTKTNYWIDVVIAIAFVLSATSGIVFLFPANGTSALGVSYRVWDQVHTWGSLLMIAGVLAHLVLHWKWIVTMTKKTFFSTGAARPASVATSASAGSNLSRREFLRAASLGAFVMGAAAIGYNSLFGSESSSENLLEVNNSTLPEAQSIPLQVIPSQSGNSSQLSVPEATAVPTQETNTIQEPAIPTAVPTQESNSIQPAAPSQSGPSSRFSAPSQPSQRTTVSCPKGLTYDPYPGRCHHYVDRDGDGYCDYSVPASA